jgi:ornithine cyclodeaminase/alanine dehydrogenase-like protein (mu-crystallin family)
MDLDEAAIRRLLRMEDVIPAMERALADFSNGTVVQPLRQIVPIADHGGLLGVMPAYTGDALGVKLVTFYPENPNRHGLPTHLATILLFKPETGEPIASMDGRLITEVRTAAVSAVATKYLARADASVLAIIGTGVQAGSHLDALRLVRRFDEVRVWSPRNAGDFARRFGVRATVSAEEAVRGADVVVTATTSKTPVISGEWLSLGVHINAVGAAGRPEWREIDDETLRRCARVYVDARELALSEYGDAIAAREIYAELGEVVTGAKLGRASAEEITLFKSGGLAVEDVVTAELIRRKAGDTCTGGHSA